MKHNYKGKLNNSKKKLTSSKKKKKNLIQCNKIYRNYKIKLKHNNNKSKIYKLSYKMKKMKHKI